MKKIAVVIFGPPGSGKGTQANLLAKKFGLIHYDTGRFLEAYVHDPKNLKTEKMKAARAAFDRGDLIDSDIVLKIIREHIAKIHQAGFGVVLSGSPRRPREAFGEGRLKGLMPLLERLYGKNHIYVFQLKIPAESSLKRNKTRLIEPLMNLPIMGTTHKLTTSPFTGAKLVKRKAIDNPQIILERLKEYEEETALLTAAFKDNGYKINAVDGTPLPYKVFDSIVRRVK